MVIVDTSQVFIATLYAQLGKHLNAKIEPDLLRHMALNSVRTYVKKYTDDYGELVIATDGKRSWRRDIFPYYKAHRRDARAASEIDWTLVFNTLADIRKELDEYFPYRVIWQENAEADDIIGTLCAEYGTMLNSEDTEQILILSGDKDFAQLLKYANVQQYDPVRKRWIAHNDPEAFLIDHIIDGDTGDGIPNILSGDNVLVEKIRQSPVTKKKRAVIAEAIRTGNMDSALRGRYERNRQLIDLSYIPEDIRKSILNKYHEQEGKDRSKIFNYLVRYRLKNLTEYAGDF